MILITGGAGYIGSHTVMSLLENNQKVVIFDNLDTGHLETVESLQKVSSLVSFVKGDLSKFEEIESVFKKHKIDSVMHFAANSIVSESVKNPQKYYYNNVFGSMNLFKAMLENGVKKLVFSSTCAVYGEPKYVPIDEMHPKNPVNPYGASKLMVEEILKDYDKEYGLKSIILRYFNVAGADSNVRIGEWHDNETHLIPNIIKSTFSKSGSFQIFGNDYNTFDGTCIRDYVNVEDLARAHILALEYLNLNNLSDVFNIGTNDGNSVKEVFNSAKKILNQDVEFTIVERREGDPDKLYADNKKAVEILKWQPKKNLDHSIKTAYEWEKFLQQMLRETTLSS